MKDKLFPSIMMALYTVVVVVLTLTFYVNLGGKPRDRSQEELRFREVAVAEYVQSDVQFYAGSKNVKAIYAEFKIGDANYKFEIRESENETLVAGAKYALRYRISDKVLKKIDIASEGGNSVSE